MKTKLKKLHLALGLGVALGLGSAQATAASPITSSLGNTAHGLFDGMFYSFIPTIQGVQAPQDAPFNAGIGIDSTGPSFSAQWTFDFTGSLPVAPDYISAASIEIGIFDHDSAHTGSQVALFELEGVSMTAEMDTLMNASGGGISGQFSEYNEYSLNLSPAGLVQLANGLATFQLDLQGPVIKNNLFGGGQTILSDNGAHLIYSTLNITVVPEPQTYGIIAGLCALGIVVWRRRSRA